MLTYPHINPIALEIGPLRIHWYGIMYLVAFAAAWYLARRRAADPRSTWTGRDVDDFIFYAMLGTIVGGRVGYVLFYGEAAWRADLWYPLKLWQGGMSFHGGFLGVLVAMAFVAHRQRVNWWALMDFVAPLVPIGLAAGRLGNFINGELWGRPTDLPWGMVFRGAGELPRHPSQLYQMALEGFTLFALLWWFSSRPRPRMQVSALFLVGYGAFRFIGEFAREPDAFLGFLALGLSMGQWLSLPMIAAGIALWYLSARR